MSARLSAAACRGVTALLRRDAATTLSRAERATAATGRNSSPWTTRPASTAAAAAAAAGKQGPNNPRRPVLAACCAATAVLTMAYFTYRQSAMRLDGTAAVLTETDAETETEAEAEAEAETRTETDTTTDTAPSDLDMITYEEVQKHVTADDCWVIIKGNVYDVTYFLDSHPGGKQAILMRAGKDVTKLFSQIHPTDALESLRPEACLGPINPDTLPALSDEDEEEEMERQEAREEMPPPQDLLLLTDFERWAERVLSKTAWYYYRSAADEETTFHENRDAFRRYFFRPRMLRDLNGGSTDTTFVGIPTAMPIFISPAAMAKLGHPLGEVNMTRAAAECGIVQGISANASCSLDEIFSARESNQPLIYQIYLNKDRSQSETLLHKVERMGARAIMFTVDTAGDSKRTLDERLKVEAAAKLREAAAEKEKEEAAGASASAPAKAPLAVGHAISGYQDRDLTWKDIGFIRRNTKLPIIVKGIQSVEDVQLCVDHGVEGVLLSNHGGRQADYAPAPIDVLYEIRVLRPDLFDKIDIMIDGGIRTGADVVKAVALGAKAVGLGRPFLYANGTHGQEGVQRVIEILHEEIANTMRNIGAATIRDLKPEMVGPAGPWVGYNRPPYVPASRL